MQNQIMEAKELSSRFYAYLKSLTENKILGNWVFLGLTDKVYSSPGGGWNGVEGFLFQSKEFEYKYILRCIIQSQYVVIESMNNDGGQLYNIGLNKNEIHKEIGDDSLIYESFNMTAGKGRKSVEEVKDAFRQLGITQNLISKINNESPDWGAFINDLLGWAIYRESAKLIIKKQPFEIEKIKNIQHSYQITQIMEQYQQILSNKPQIILQGPPGTGKTYTAKDIAEFMIKRKVSVDKKEQKKVLEESDQFKLIQFHPSYTYEDFVRGIVAKPNENGGGVLYKTENKTLGEFAAAANKSFIEYSQNIKEEDKIDWIKERFKVYCSMIEEQLQRGHNYYFNGSKEYANELSLGVIKLYSDSFSQGSGFAYTIEEIEKFLLETFDSRFLPQKLNGKPGRLTNSLLFDFRKYAGEAPKSSDTESIPLKNFVLIIDEINRANLPAVLGELIYSLEYRGDALDGMYDIDGDRKIIIPSNLYIIGTMNTADRSVGHIDYAIRRRFAFVDILPDKSVLKLPLAVEFFEAIENLFEKHTASDFEKQHVLLGHSYFLADNNKTLKLKLKYEVLPILNEYLNDGVINKTEASVQLLKEISDKIDKIDE
jgi:MoxR-like ATPase